MPSYKEHFHSLTFNFRPELFRSSQLTAPLSTPSGCRPLPLSPPLSLSLPPSPSLSLFPPSSACIHLTLSGLHRAHQPPPVFPSHINSSPPPPYPNLHRPQCGFKCSIDTQVLLALAVADGPSAWSAVDPVKKQSHLPTKANREREGWEGERHSAFRLSWAAAASCVISAHTRPLSLFSLLSPLSLINSPAEITTPATTHGCL